MENQIIIGLTGSIGSGCSIIGKDFFEKEMEFTYHSLSEHIKEEVDKNFKESGRNSKPNILDYQNYGNKLRKETDNYGYWAEKLFELHPGLEKSKKLVIDSIRNCGEVYFLRNKFPNFYLIGVYADSEIRENRLKKQHSDIPYEIIERAEKRDKGEVWDYGQQVSACMEQADFIIKNNDLLNNAIRKDILRNLKKLIGLIEIPGSEIPLEQEINMNHAYSVSLVSECIKRQVGAVIIDGDGKKIISKGFNRIPNEESQTCWIENHDCYRDMQRKKFAEDFKSCLACGEELHIPEVCENTECDFEINRQIITAIKMLDLCRSIHAEEDVIFRALKNNYNDFENSILYTTTFPCLMCAKMIINVGIKRIVFVEPYPVKMAEQLLKEAGVKITMFEGVKAQAYNKLFKKERDFKKKMQKRVES